MSRRELAERCGISESSVSRIESFETSPKIDTILRMMSRLWFGLTITAVAGK